MLIRTIPTSFIAVAILASLALLGACEPANQQSGQEAAPAGGDTSAEAAETTPMVGRLPDAFKDVPAVPPRKSHWTMRDPGCGHDEVPEHHRQLFPDGTALSFVESEGDIAMVDRGGLPKQWTRVDWTARHGQPLQRDLDDCADGASILAHVLSEGAEHLHATVELEDGDGIRHAHDVFAVARGISRGNANSRGEVFFIAVDAASITDRKGDDGGNKHVGTAHGAH